MTDRITIFGYGPVGRAAVDAARGRGPRGDRSAAAPRAAGPGEGSNVRALRRARPRGGRQGGARHGQFVVAIGFAYSGVIWREAWPKAIGNFVAACKATGARMAFIDNPLHVRATDDATGRDDAG